jgi:hypothetical protein
VKVEATVVVEKRSFNDEKKEAVQIRGCGWGEERRGGN